MKNISHKDLIPVWRIVVAIIATQFAGSFISYFIKPYHFTFINIWIGGALGTFTGFFIGAVWHFAKKERRGNLIVLPIIGVLGLITLMVTLSSVFVVIPRFAGEAKRIGLMRDLSSNVITKIDVYNEDGKKLLKIIKDKEIISQFSVNCKDTEGYAPNHPKYSHSWYLIIHMKNDKLELDCNFLKNDNSKVCGDFVHRERNYLKCYGSFKSQNLKKWFDKYLITR